MNFRIFHSARFNRELLKFDSSFKKQVDKIEDQLVENPFAGDHLNIKWFREKRIGVHRVYYFVYEDLQSVFMVAISGKKDQQKVINTLRLITTFLREEIENLIKKDKFT
jgi:mRNA-degrading endonuclease RelE of RelBE toxin-antitoxin system